MKYIITIVILLASLGQLQAQDINDPENLKSVAHQFLKAIVNENFEVAKQLGTDDTDQMIEQIKMYSKMIPDSLKGEMDAARRSAQKAVLTFSNVQIKGDRATMNFTSDETPEIVEPLVLKLINNTWLVDFGGGVSDDAGQIEEEEMEE